MPERYDINGNPIGFFSVEDEGMRYVDPTVIQPAVVSANRKYWEAQKWARENVRDPRERTAPYVAAGLGAAMAAPVAIDLAASGLASAAADPLWKAAARRMAIDLPAFEAIDRLPQAWGDDRLTTQGTNLIKQTTLIGRFAPWAVDVAGPFIAGMVPGMAGDMMVRGTAAGVNGVLNGIGRRIANNRTGYLAPMADVLNTETTQRFEIPNRVYVEDPATHEISLMDAARANQLVEQGLPEQYVHTTVPGVDPAIELDLPFVTDHPIRVQRPTDVEAELNRLVNARRIPRGNAEFTPEETARLQAMIGDHPIDLANYTPEQIAQAQAQMQMDAPIIHDALAGNRAAPVEEQTFLRQPVMDAAMPNGYQIARYPGGYMLKSLMSGNPLEKQISKNGTVNVNNIKALISKGGKVEQAVVDKVLASEQFAGKKAIDYNDFRKAVQDELITYDRTPDTRWEDYGMGRLGFGPNFNGAADDYIISRELYKWAERKGYKYNPEAFTSANDGDMFISPDGKNVTYDELEKLFMEDVRKNRGAHTYTFSSSRIPHGSAKHYDKNTLGHSRTYTTANEPDVLHVMESQSDWAQSGGGDKKRPPFAFNADGSYDREMDQKLNEFKRSLWGLIDRGEISNDAANAKIKEYMARLQREKFGSLVDQEKYLSDNYASRQIQENLRYAAEKGQKKMRYPTRETAAKIEGYPERTKYYTKEGTEVSDPYMYPDETAREIEILQNEIDKIDLADLDSYAPFNIKQEAFLQRDLNEKGTAKLLAALRERIIRDKDSLHQMRVHGDDNPMVEERLYNNMKLFDSEISKYKSRYGREPALDKIMEESRNARSRRAEIGTRMKELLNTPQIIKPGLEKKTVYDYEDILRKYTEFPKQYKKLFKGADARIVTDPKGNTWYEVDVPENYLQQEWPYKNGGLLDRLNRHYNGDRSKIIQAIQYARGGFKRDAATDAGDQYYDIVRQRRNSAFNALLRAGMNPDDAARLAPMIVTQQTMEGGWVLNRKDNNYGGMKSAGKTIAFDSEDDFQDAYIKMLDSKWHNGRTVENSWRSAKDLDDWARILNREDLGLTTKEAWEKYNKGKQGNDFVYLYAPQWENNNKPYREHLKKTEGRAAAYLKMVDADEPYSSLVPKQEVPQMPPAPQQSSQPLGLFRSLIPTSVQQKMPATQSAPVQQQAPLLRSLIPTSVQKKMNDRAAGGLIERYGVDKVRAAMQKVKR